MIEIKLSYEEITFDRTKKIPNFRTPERPTSVHEHHIYGKSTTHVNRTYSRTYWFIYIDSGTDILYYYTHTQLVLMNSTSVYTPVH